MEGNIYEGDFDCGFFEGMGHFRNCHGDTYIGQFHKNLFDGNGQLNNADGIVYNGGFKNGKKNGDGLLLLPNGDKYEGKFQEDLFHGEGVYTNCNGDEQARNYILDSLWAFNAKFIIQHSKVESLNDRQFTALEGAIKAIQEKLCEDANPLVLALIDNIDRFIDDAIGADGRGHFLSGYDGEENEQDGFYIYRTN